ncbi:MAG: Na+/H+ antiporter NhaA [Micavibrio sp.]|nr:Na+/H+ antiporter NhaA [Micavibrio sp.]|tara:strand:+ start:1914 stop:3083 length:1170 start_codon:yes stop_codon:yes gene_type:complete
MGAIVRFFHSKTAPGILLCLAAFLAMVIENSPYQGLYDGFKNIPVVFQAGDFLIDKPLLLWINDGLMAIFFLLIGLEIKREILDGHLSKRDQVILPAVAALGGLAVPALIYAFINWGNAVTIQGWAIPAATDIAFALGVLILLGNRIPPALKVCLVAIAIIDDLAAIVIIALFYTAETSLMSLGLAFIGLTAAFVMNRRGVIKLGPYILLGFFIWACVLKSGVHATLAGVALGLLIPLRTKTDPDHSPLLQLEHTLHPFVAFVVLPVFAFANAGVSLSGLSLATFMQPIPLGIMLGLFFGKQLGVMGLTFLAISIKLCKLPEGVNWMQFYGMALLTGIGFTMSLFIGTLAFSDVEYASDVRVGVLSGSILSGVAGVSILLMSTHKRKVK